jgi:uncharacterized phage protein (TIGR02220 family)
MAERRMFAKSVIESDIFLDLSATARLLYFDLGMRGDDDGFVDSPRRVMRITGASDDDLKLLIAKHFLIPFESGVVVIRHWKIHNYLRSDRYKPTLYQQEKELLTEGASGIYDMLSDFGIPTVHQPSTECLPSGSIGKDRLGKVRGTEDRGGEEPDACASPPTPYSEIVNLFNSICKSYPKLTRLSEARKKAIKARLNQYSLDDFKRLFELAEASEFLKGKNNRNWTANFDWLIKDANMAKVFDGNFNNKTASTKSTDFTDTARYENNDWGS